MYCKTRGMWWENYVHVMKLPVCFLFPVKAIIEISQEEDKTEVTACDGSAIKMFHVHVFWFVEMALDELRLEEEIPAGMNINSW